MLTSASERRPDPGDQPDHDTKLRTLRGEATGWTYWFRAAPVCTARWNDEDWIAFIGKNWLRRVA